MTAATVIGQYVKGAYWAISTNDFYPGANATVTVSGTQVSDITGISYDVIIDGLTVYAAQVGAGIVVAPKLQSRKVITYLKPLTTVLALDAVAWTPLGVPLSLEADEAFLILTTTTGGAHTIRVCVWGHYTPQPSDKLPPEAVVVEGYKWPLTRRY